MTPTIFKSRFGFHPCDYELYTKLKFLHRIYWETLRQFHTWHRWYRKQPQNRIGTEPSYCSCFVQNTPWVKAVVRDGKRGFRRYPRKVVDHQVIDLYHAARMPSELPQESFSAEDVSAIENLYATVIEYFAAQEQTELAGG